MTLEQIGVLTKQDYHRLAAELKPETRMFIDCRLTDARAGRRFETANPATDEAIASVPLGGPEDVDFAVAVSRRAFKSGVWSKIEPRARAAVMYRMADLIEQHRLEFGLLESLDVGKPIADVVGANGDVEAAALTFRYFGETIDKIEGSVTNTAANAFHYIIRQPLGVVACIAPWPMPKKHASLGSIGTPNARISHAFVGQFPSFSPGRSMPVFASSPKASAYFRSRAFPSHHDKRKK